MNKKLDNKPKDEYNKFTSESGHWYTREGEPMYTIIGANGKERNTTLRAVSYTHLTLPTIYSV